MTNTEAIKILTQRKWCGECNTDCSCKECDMAFDMAIKALEQEPRIGHWIEHDRKALREQGYYRCSECNHGYQRYERGIRKSEVPYINGQKYELHRIDKFCPNCGARMKSEE